MKNILMITNFITFPWEKGNSRFIYILNKINYTKNNVEVITTNFRHATKSKREIPENEKYPYKITLIKEPGYSKNISLKRIFSHKILAKNISKYLKTIEKPDVIYCSIPSLDVAKTAAKYAKKNKIKFILDIQDLWPEAFKMIFNPPIIGNMLYFPLTQKANYIYKSADEIIGVSETYVKRATKVNTKYKNKASVYLGTDLNTFDKIDSNDPKDKKNIIIGYIGTLGNSYNIVDLIRAIKILNDKGLKNITLLIIGDGPLRQKFEEEAQKCKINCNFTGRLSYEDMVKKLKTFDIAINPIVNGSAGSIINKVGDYAAAGLPVVNTQECKEYRSLIEEYNAGLNCENNPQDISDKIEKLIKDKNLRLKMGTNNRKLAEEKFNRNITYNQIIKIIERG